MFVPCDHFVQTCNEITTFTFWRAFICSKLEAIVSAEIVNLCMGADAITPWPVANFNMEIRINSRSRSNMSCLYFCNKI